MLNVCEVSPNGRSEWENELYELFRKKTAKHLCIRQIIRSFATAFAQSLSGKTERSLVCCVVTINNLIKVKQWI